MGHHIHATNLTFYLTYRLHFKLEANILKKKENHNDIIKKKLILLHTVPKKVSSSKYKAFRTQ